MLSTAYGREKGNFIPRMQRCAPCGEFLIARGDQRRAKAREFGMACTIVREKLLDQRTIAKLDGVFRLADDLLQSAEEKNFYARSL